MTTQPSTKRPSHEVFVVEGEGDKAKWIRVGAAWRHDDGEGFSINLSALPINGRLVVRQPKPQQEKAR